MQAFLSIKKSYKLINKGTIVIKSYEFTPLDVINDTIQKRITYPINVKWVCDPWNKGRKARIWFKNKKYIEEVIKYFSTMSDNELDIILEKIEQEKVPEVFKGIIKKFKTVSEHHIITDISIGDEIPMILFLYDDNNKFIKPDVMEYKKKKENVFSLAQFKTAFPKPPEFNKKLLEKIL